MATLSKYAETSSGSSGSSSSLQNSSASGYPEARIATTAASTAYGVCRCSISIAVDDGPERAGPALVGHADAARVREADPVDLADELDVRVPADDETLLHPGERGPEPLVRRDARQDLVVVARRAVAVEHAAQRERRAGARAGTRARADRGARRPSPRGPPGRAATRGRRSRARRPRRDRRACREHSRGKGPATTSPPTTISSTSSVETSASTASSAGRLPCTSLRTATRIVSPRWRAQGDGWDRRRAGAARRRRRRGPDSRRS